MITIILIIVVIVLSVFLFVYVRLSNSQTELIIEQEKGLRINKEFEDLQKKAIDALKAHNEDLIKNLTEAQKLLYEIYKKQNPNSELTLDFETDK